MPYSKSVENKLKRLPYMPIEQYEQGWERKGITYPTFKEYLWTAQTRKHYDVFMDVRIKGDIRSYWIFYGTIGDFAKRQSEVIEEAIADIEEAYEAEEFEELEFTLDFLWRSQKAEEEV